MSWKYVTESVEKGEILNIEDYRIHQTRAPRPAGSNQSTKAVRTPFTKQDDEILVAWVHQYDGGAGGNAMYRELAEKVRSSRDDA